MKKSQQFVLGVYLGHDSNAALVSENGIIAAAQEERFVGKKHFYGFPSESIKFILKQANLQPQNINFIACPHITGKFQLSPPTAIVAELLKLKIANYQKIINIDHHLAHASSAYRCSGWKKATIITLDGSGNNLSGTIYYGCNGKLQKISESLSNGSLGWFYSAVTQALGFCPNDEEGKTMSLAAYGKKDQRIIDQLQKYVPNLKGLILHRNVPWKILTKPVGGFLRCHFEDSKGIRNIVKKYGKENVAACAQAIVEGLVIRLVKNAVHKTGCGHLAVAGGVFFNVKLNMLLEELPCVKEIRPHPAAGDGGLSLGAALEATSMITNKKIIFDLKNIYLGPSFKNRDVLPLLKAGKFKSWTVNFKKIPGLVSKYLQQGLAVGWFQGRMEYGARALGNRSVLLDPRNLPAMKRLNLKLKRREWFMPFAPAILVEHINKYIGTHKAPYSPFMLKAFKLKKTAPNNISGCTHIDGTARIQSVIRTENPLYYDLIKKFYKDMTVPALLNTSFNRHGLPMVCSPQDAIWHLKNKCIDVLVINNMIIENKNET